MKLLPKTQKSIYSKVGSSYTVKPFGIYNYWLGLVVISGGFDMTYVYPEQSSVSLDNIIIRKGDVHCCNSGNPLKRTKFLMNNYELPYPHESADNFFKGTAIQDNSSYVCFHQIAEFGPEFAKQLEQTEEWPWPNLCGSSLLSSNRTFKFDITKDSYIYVADGSILVNGKPKQSGEWLVASSDKEISIDVMEGESVIAFLK